ncbi:hypothetical protein EMPG_14044 [Blastomyces silverae]|uniref:Cytochrome P450 oxidoreductase n=1 Tax=Blastomyces silverae TaxID=2060906 RepID=A0A0H1BGF5_9EURO|nr:hypothetical protein EMPG_14044 [Blastomyces silverae]
MFSRFAVWTGLSFGLIVLIFFFSTHSFQPSVLSFIVLSLFLSIDLVVSHVILYPIFFTPFKHIPTPPGRSIWNGHFAQFTNEPGGLAARRWMLEVPNSGLLRFYLAGNTERIMVLSPKAIAEVLVSKYDDYERQTQMKDVMEKKIGHGLILAEGDRHRHQRKVFKPAFSFRHIKGLYQIFWSKGVEMTKAMEKDFETSRKDPKAIRIADLAQRTTLDIIGLAGMGYDFSSIQNPTGRLSIECGKIFPPVSKFTLFAQFFSSLISPRLFTRLPIKHNRDVQEGGRYVRNFCERLLHDKQQKIEKKETGHIDIISVAMENGEFTNRELVDQIMTFLAAGHQSTSAAFQLVVYVLCKYPEIQTRLREEIRSSLPSISLDSPVPISASLIDSLPYLHAVCNETLRFYPPLPFLQREAVRDTVLLDTFIPKGTIISISPAVTNHDPELWGPDAGIFNPERWMGPGNANSGGATSNYAFLTFFHGPRSCIGAAFGQAELACLVAVTVGRFEMELLDPGKELRIKHGPLGVPEDGVVVKLKIVEGW